MPDIIKLINETITQIRDEGEVRPYIRYQHQDEVQPYIRYQHQDKVQPDIRYERTCISCTGI
jgi:hypothetical protein